MIKKILLGLLALIVVSVGVILAVAATKSDDFTVQRSIDVDAAPDHVFTYLNDFHQFTAWSPWQRMDPNMQTTFEGPATGTGASYSWRGNDQVGEGRMTITNSRANELVVVNLEFLKPWEATNQVEWRVAANGDNSRVTWVMTGKQAFMMKVFTLFMDMDAVVGADFERGLANLKQLAEAGH